MWCTVQGQRAEPDWTFAVQADQAAPGKSCGAAHADKVPLYDEESTQL